MGRGMPVAASEAASVAKLVGLAGLTLGLVGCGFAAPSMGEARTAIVVTPTLATAVEVAVAPTVVPARVVPASPSTATAVPVATEPTVAMVAEGGGGVAAGTGGEREGEGEGKGPSRIVEYAETGRAEVALTFDAGADRGNAEAILDLLAERGVKASFGILGQWAVEHPDLVRRMVDEGHLLFNHSWDHASFTGGSTGEGPLSREERIEQLARTEAVVRDLTGYELRPYFRPAYGDIDAEALADIGAAGYGVTLLWSCDSRDSLGAGGAEILANCIENARPGRIVLLHVGAQSAAYDVLPETLDLLAAEGLTPVRVDELLRP